LKILLLEQACLSSESDAQRMCRVDLGPANTEKWTLAIQELAVAWDDGQGTVYH
jgi:hypothetical protein